MKPSKISCRCGSEFSTLAEMWKHWREGHSRKVGQK